MKDFADLPYTCMSILGSDKYLHIHLDPIHILAAGYHIHVNFKDTCNTLKYVSNTIKRC